MYDTVYEHIQYIRTYLDVCIAVHAYTSTYVYVRTYSTYLFPGVCVIDGPIKGKVW